MAERDINSVGLATAINTSHGAIGHWARGERQPNYGNCIKLARYFGIPEDDILTMVGHRPNVTSDYLRISDLRASYDTGPRAHLDNLVDQLTDEQIETLITFLETFHK